MSHSELRLPGRYGLPSRLQTMPSRPWARAASKKAGPSPIRCAGRAPRFGVEAEAREQFAAALVRLGDERFVVEVQKVERDVAHRHLDRAALDRLGPRQAHPALKRLKAGAALGVERHHLAVEDRRRPPSASASPVSSGIAMARVLAAARRDPHRAALDPGKRPHPVPLDLERPAVALGRRGRGRREHRLEVAGKRVGHSRSILIAMEPKGSRRSAAPAGDLGEARRCPCRRRRTASRCRRRP